MKQSHKLAGIAAALSLGVAVAAYAHPGHTGSGMRQHGGMQHKEGMGHGARDGMEHHGMGGGAEHGHGQQLMSSEERTALREKMRNARTPEERQKIAEATRTEMQKRSQEKGITPREHHGPRSGAATEHAH